MDQLDRTEGVSHLQWTGASDRTTSSGRRYAVLVDERRVVPSVAYNRLRQPFERAEHTGNEGDWERFVELVAGLTDSLTQDEGLWLIDAAYAVPSRYRVAAALARALACIASSAAWRPPALSALRGLARHPSPEVRLQALEAAADVDALAAATLAELLCDDTHPAVQRAANSIRPQR